ncbi:MAG: VOC family protein [Ilumatobacteraceae bacterium]
MTQPTVWPCLNYRDARAAIAFVTEAFGFVEQLVVPGETDDVVVHSQLVWPEGGGVMIGTADREDSEFSQLPTSCASVYVVTDDPHGVYKRAIAAGAKVVREMRDEDYGSTGFSVRDPEDNIWSFGTYRGEGDG